MGDFEPINYKRGFLQLIILSLLSQKDMYGYQLVQETAKQSAGKYITQEGSLYPILYKLLEGGFITSYEQYATSRLRHIYYHLEEKGFLYLEFLQKQFDEVIQGIRLILKEDIQDNE